MKMDVIFLMPGTKGQWRCVFLIQKYAKVHQKDINVYTYETLDRMLFGIDGRESGIDLLFLDVRIDGREGVEIVNELRQRGFYGEVIFLTDNADEWQKAFDIHAFHYVVESECSDERFEWIISEAVKVTEKRYQESLTFFCAGRRAVVALKEIKYFECRDRWIKVHYGEKEFEFYSQMGRLEQRLTGKDFMRVHRSFLVSLHFIMKIKYGELTLTDGTRIPVSRGKYPELKSRLKKIEEIIGSAWEWNSCRETKEFI